MINRDIQLDMLQRVAEALGPDLRKNDFCRRVYDRSFSHR